VLGNKWQMLPQIGWWCMFPACALLFSGPLDRMPDMVGRQKLSVAMQLTSDIIMLAIMFLCIQQGKPALTTIAAISVSLALYNLTWLGVILHLIGSTIAHIFSLYLRFLLLFLLSFAAQYGLHYLAWGNLGLLAGGIVMVLSCGAGLLWLVRGIVADKNRDVAALPSGPHATTPEAIG
jgi:hypothetical protein